MANDARGFEVNGQEIIFADDTHREIAVHGREGVHGFRAHDGYLQLKNEEKDEWENVVKIGGGGGGGGGTGLPPAECTNSQIKVGNQKLTVSWTDPADSTTEGVTVTWAGTKVVYKAGSAPANDTDGTVAVDSKTRNQYATDGFTINGLTNETKYYVCFFPYSTEGAVNTGKDSMVSGTPRPFRTMTVKIDQSNSNPSTSVTYADDAVGMTPGSADWDDFFNHYPVLLKDGVEVGRLSKTDFSKFENGGSADITSGNAGDVMIAFPRMGLKISTSGNIVTVSMTDNPDDSGFFYNAHTRGSARKDVFYLGAYKGSEISGKLRSLSGKTPAANKTIGAFRTIAKANGSGYDQSAFYQLIFRQAMYILKYKNLDSQTAVGKGVCGSSVSAAKNTGGTNTRGMDYGTTSTSDQVKLFGLEDFWGNIYEWIDGLFCDSSYNIMVGNDNYNDTGAGYKNCGKGATANIGGYISKVQGTTDTGFIIKEKNGSESTYFADYGSLDAGYLPFFGGDWGAAAGSVGAFRLSVTYSASGAGADVGGRLMFV